MGSEKRFAVVSLTSMIVRHLHGFVGDYRRQHGRRQMPHIARVDLASELPATRELDEREPRWLVDEDVEVFRGGRGNRLIRVGNCLPEAGGGHHHDRGSNQGAKYGFHCGFHLD